MNIVHQDGNQVISVEMQSHFGRTGRRVQHGGLGLMPVDQSRGCGSHTRKEPPKEPRQRESARLCEMPLRERNYGRNDFVDMAKHLFYWQHF